MGGWTQADIDRIQREHVAARPRPSKYRNVKTVSFDGHKFDSKREAQRWTELTMRQKADEIRVLKRQVPFDLLAPNATRDGYVVIAQYLADFVYIDCRTGERIIEDAKGKRTQMYLLKRKWLELQDGITIHEV